MNKINKYEQVYVNLTWIFILLAFVQMLIRDNFLENLNLVIFDKICTNCAIVFLIFILDLIYLKYIF